MNKRWTRWLCVALAALFLLGNVGCGRKSGGEAAVQQLLDAYSKKVTALGYDLSVLDTDVSDEDSPEEKETTCVLNKSLSTSDHYIWLRITRTVKGMKSLRLSIDPNNGTWDFDLIRSLAGSLMQSCDASFLQGEGQAVALANAVAKANDSGKPLERNGKQFCFGLYDSSIDLKVEYPKENYAMDARTLASEKGQPLKYLSLPKAALLKNARQAYGSLGYSLEKSDIKTADPNPLLNPNLAETPEVYQLEHKFGYIGGYLLIYANEQRIYQVAFLKPHGMDYFLSFEMGSSILLSICDPSLEGDPIAQDSAAYMLYQNIQEDDEAENNGLRYEMPVFLNCVTVEAYE